MLLQSLNDLGVEGAPFIGGFFLEVLMNRLRQSEIKPDYWPGKITLFHIPSFYCYAGLLASLDMPA